MPDFPTGICIRDSARRLPIPQTAAKTLPNLAERIASVRSKHPFESAVVESDFQLVCAQPSWPMPALITSSGPASCRYKAMYWCALVPQIYSSLMDLRWITSRQN